jgi:pimeloyl-ACP methyl ester carboxylesterase
MFGFQDRGPGRLGSLLRGCAAIGRIARAAGFGFPVTGDKPLVRRDRFASRRKQRVLAVRRTVVRSRGNNRAQSESGVAIFHGTDDEIIPVRMGGEVAREFPVVEFFLVEQANHVSVLNHGHDKIIDWMNR